MESLLVATDFSPDAANAARRAALLGAALGARHARLLHVAPQPPLAAELELKANRAIEQLLGENIDALRRESGFGFAPQLATGAVVDEICRAARADDLIVVGAHGLHPLRDFAIGTTAERLLRKSARPVLVVKRPPAGACRSVLVPVDFSPDSAAALEVAQRVAAAAELHLAHAFEGGIEGKLRFAACRTRKSTATGTRRASRRARRWRIRSPGTKGTPLSRASSPTAIRPA